MKCIIVEDQPPAQRILKKYITDHGSLVLQGVFMDGLKALEFLQENETDLIFLDLHMPKLSGMELLRNFRRETPIILTTAYGDFALESYEYNVVDYLLKPFSFARFVKAVNKVLYNPIEKDDIPEEKFLFIKSGYEHVRIDYKDILFIKADNDYTEIYLADKKHLSAESLKYWQEFLEEDHFVRIHKSYLVNIINIVKVTSTHVDVATTDLLPIGRAYKDSFMRQITEV